ncbi:MAG: hypothetical protein OCD76_01800 [Reichenbachiella sp.]
MPISSYLALPSKQGKQQLIKELSSFSKCEVIPSKNKDVVIVITDTSTRDEQEQLLAELNELEAVQQLTMVSGYQNQ